mmetsp:Transcript_15867/g.23954  ORF Transcript_15867/g.23954 Transcript_15867/m.23954 type:complete len:237 (+) Transcript_15867:389-1099(+)
MKKENGDLQIHTSTQDRFSDLCHGTSHKKAGRHNTNHRSEGKDGLDNLWEKLIGCHPNCNGSKDNLNSRLGNSCGINWDNCSQHRLTQKWSHQNCSNSSSSSHQHTQCNISLGNVSTQVTRLSTIDTSNKNHTSQKSSIQSKSLTKTECQCRHHTITERELHQYGARLLGNFHKILRCQGNTHGKHKCCQRRCEIFRGEEIECRWLFESNGSEQDSPEGEEGCGSVGCFCVYFKDF